MWQTELCIIPQTCDRTSRASLQSHCNNRHNVSQPVPKHTGTSQKKLHIPTIPELNPHFGTVVSQPIPKHTGTSQKSPTSPQSRSSNPTSAQRITTSTEAYRHKSKKAPHPHNPGAQSPFRHSVSQPIPKHTGTSQKKPHIPTIPALHKKKPEGCAEGPWLYGPFAVFHSFSKQKTRHPAKEENQDNKFIKKYTKNKNRIYKGEKA